MGWRKGGGKHVHPPKKDIWMLCIGGECCRLILQFLPASFFFYIMPRFPFGKILGLEIIFIHLVLIDKTKAAHAAYTHTRTRKDLDGCEFPTLIFHYRLDTKLIGKGHS